MRTRLYRIAKEAVHNAIKHANPSELIIRLCDQDRLVLEIQDDGQGLQRPTEEIEGNGIQLIKRIKDHDLSIQDIVCSMHDENLYAERCLRAGASGYVHKQAPARAMLDAIDQVMADKVYTTAKIPIRATGAGQPPTGSPIGSLAKRELEVLTLIGQGLMNAQIADQMGVSPRTVDTYRERIKAKLSLRTASELNRRAVQWVLLNEQRSGQHQEGYAHEKKNSGLRKRSCQRASRVAAGHAIGRL